MQTVWTFLAIGGGLCTPQTPPPLAYGPEIVTSRNSAYKYDAHNEHETQEVHALD